MHCPLGSTPTLHHSRAFNQTPNRVSYMSTTTLLNLRVALHISAESLAHKSCISIDKLSAIENGEEEPPESIINFYSENLKIKSYILRTLLNRQQRKIFIFESIRVYFLKIFNNYLKMSIWMSNKNESKESLSSKPEPLIQIN